jgi:cob(I)alamin adenosyltransferase
VSWGSRFEEPIVLPHGIRLASLRAAIIHLVVTIPSAERSTPAVLTAVEMLTNAAEHGGSIELARIATLRAINRHAERAVNPDRKDTHGASRKLKRDA